jgi:membrane protein implicated in regulation of membrane protease activity
MSYAVEWTGGGLVPVYGIVLLLLIVPEFAAIAVVVATIAVLVALVALAAAALASPYLLVRGVRRRRRPTKHTIYPLAQLDRGADRRPDRLRVVGRARVTAFAHDAPDEAAAIFEDATRDAA